MQHYVEFRFYEELNDFLAPEKRKKIFSHFFAGTPSIKDTIESLGVPHTEIDLILVNGVSVDFTYLLKDGDQISVYPVFEAFDISEITSVREKPLREPRFILDVHLGRLAKYLRLLGFDTWYQNDYSDTQLIHLAKNNQRITLSRDKELFKNKEVTHGYWLRSTKPKKQLIEVINRFDLAKKISPFKRCLLCNGKLQPIEKKKIAATLQEKTKQYYHLFYCCNLCKKIYWQGTHFNHMQTFINQLWQEIK